ncbi:GTP-binding protein rho1 [Chytriomyces cf. hyalinus JEL632]|nr:GTP-binding protein rho1 [Chytriomyces cf. hyalinus JEL632]
MMKVVIVGDGACGKTSLLHVFTRRDFPQSYTPTVFENTTVVVTLKHHGTIRMQLSDTAGQEHLHQMRKMSYDGADVVLVAFDVASWVSFENVELKWAPDARINCGSRVPIVLVGLKTDLRRDSRTVDMLQRTGNVPIAYHDGHQLAKTIGAHAYIECSSLENMNVDDVFLAASRAFFKVNKFSPSSPAPNSKTGIMRWCLDRLRRWRCG